MHTLKISEVRQLQIYSMLKHFPRPLQAEASPLQTTARRTFKRVGWVVIAGQKLFVSIAHVVGGGGYLRVATNNPQKVYQEATIRGQLLFEGGVWLMKYGITLAWSEPRWLLDCSLHWEMTKSTTAELQNITDQLHRTHPQD